jgi:hypothetical protein
LKLQQIYRVLGHAEKLGWADTPLPHALAYHDRLLVYNWFSRWLQGNRALIKEEPPSAPLPPASLWATETGSVIRSLHSATPYLLVRSMKPQKGSRPLAELLGMKIPDRVPCEVIASVQTPKLTINCLEIRSEPEVTLPAFLISSRGLPPKAPVLLVLDEMAAERLWFQPEADDVMPENCPVMICAAEVRGIGALSPQVSPGAAEYEEGHQREEDYAWSSLYFGRPLAGQRARDIISIVRALQALPATSGRSIHLAARGRLTFPALLAAALDPQLASLYLSGGLAAVRLLTEVELPMQPFAQYVPGWLNQTDIPDLITSLAPRKVVWSGPVDASSFPLETAAQAEIFSASVASGNLSLPGPEKWSAEILLSRPL